MKTTEQPVITEEFFSVNKEELWNAITKIDLMTKWFFENIPDFKPEVGFYTEFNVNSGERDFFHQWEIIEVIPFEKIIYKWTYKEYEGESKVIFEIIPEDSKSKLILTNIVTKDFSDDIPEFKRESCVGGWEYFINKRLKEYMK